jgi:Protein of unknown function (DUF2490)
MTQIQRLGSNVAHAVLFVVALSATAPADAQTETEPRMWMAVSLQGRAGSDSPWRWVADSQVGTRNGAGTMDFMAEWVSVSRDLTRRSSGGVGYAFGAGFPDAGFLREHRFVQQYVWRADAAGRVSFRTQLEERFVSGQDAMLVRVRQRVRATWPLTARGSLRGVVSEEVFVRANSTVRAARGFDSNELFVGIRRKVTAQSGVEIGYVNVYSPGASRHKRCSHVMSATLVVSL